MMSNFYRTNVPVDIRRIRGDLEVNLVVFAAGASNLLYLFAVGKSLDQSALVPGVVR